jgi:hypothetical protein
MVLNICDPSHQTGYQVAFGVFRAICTPAYSLHPKLHFDTNLIFVSLLVPETLAIFSTHLKMKDLGQDFHYFTIT